MDAKTAVKYSPVKIAIRYGTDGYCWLFHPSGWPHLVIATDHRCNEQTNDVLWRVEFDSGIVLDYDDWEPSPDTNPPQILRKQVN